MPSSSNAVFFENGILVDYFGDPINLGIIPGGGGTGPTGYNAVGVTDQQKISHIAYVLINQNVDKTTTKKYNYTKLV